MSTAPLSALRGKHIILGITGSIAAYKAAVLVRLFVKNGAEVQVVMTPAACEFITPVTLSTLSGRPVLTEFFDDHGSWNSHVDLGLWADAMVVAPATASTLGKMAHGIADNMLVTSYLSCRARCIVAPAMDLDMYLHPSTQASLDTLRKHGCIVIEPAEGELASHLIGKGRMAEPEEIAVEVAAYLGAQKSFDGTRVLITSGPTYERIDPVRFVGNFSTGKMGLQLAEVFAESGADVTFVTGPVADLPTHPSVSIIQVESAEEMYCAVMDHAETYQIAVLCAAVADYRPAEVSQQKIKREVTPELLLKLVPNKDISAELGRIKRPDQMLIGFALETRSLTGGALDNAREKLMRKGLDLIVLNTLAEEGAGLRHDTNKVTVVAPTGVLLSGSLKSKREVAQDLVALAAEQYPRKA